MTYPVKLYNRRKVSSATTGTGTLTLGSAVSGFKNFTDIPNNTVVHYVIEDGSAYECGQGTVAATGTTLSRDTIYDSSNSNAAISCSGTQVVFIDGLSADFFGDRNLNYTVTDYGIKNDGVRHADGAITTGTTSFASATSTFTSADVGKTISIIGAGASSATLTTTIAAFVDATHVTLTATAGTTVTAAEFFYGTDNATAINSLITTVEAAGGGSILFPNGFYLFSSALDLSSCQNIVLTGPQRVRNRYYNNTNASLIYTGSGSNAILLGSSTGCTIQNFWLNYTSKAFTGNYIYVANTVALDACYNKIQGCLFYTIDSSRNTVGYWIRFYKAICNQVLDNTFVGGASCISGTLAAGEYVNQLTISDNLFAAYTGVVINGGFQECTVSNNTFEGRSDGQGIAYQNSSTTTSQGMIWTGNWFGDVTSGVGNPWIYYWGGGFVFSGNFMAANTGSVGIMLNACTGFQITGNYFTSFANVITYNNATCKGGIVMGNFASSYTNFETLTANKDATCSTNFNAL